MVIDFHTHIFPDEIAERAIASLSSKVTIVPSFQGSKAGLLASMKNAGIDYSVILPVVTKPTQTKKANEWAKEVDGDGIIAFGGLHPDNEDYKEQIDFICSLGLKGIKMHPDYQDFFVDEPKMLPVYEYIFQKGLILLFHAGVDIGLPAPYHCPPNRLRKVLDQLKGGKIVAAHLGGHEMWEDVGEYLVGTDVYLDTSMGLEYFSAETLKQIVSTHSSEKILFGTDAPWSNQKEELIRIQNAGLTPKQLEDILYLTAKKLLEL
jgi:predicted TIM-barrel fold metal-dependent hydrolase